MSIQWAGAVSVLLTSSVKLLFAGPLSYSLGHDMLTTMVLLSAGGMLGMTVFFLSAKGLLELFRRRYLKRVEERAARGLPPKPIFTRTNRFIVRVKRSYGVWGIAAVGPAIISIPISAVLAAKYFKHDRRTLPIMLGAVVVWSIGLSLVWSFLG